VHEHLVPHIDANMRYSAPIIISFVFFHISEEDQIAKTEIPSWNHFTNAFAKQCFSIPWQGDVESPTIYFRDKTGTIDPLVTYTTILVRCANVGFNQNFHFILEIRPVYRRLRRAFDGRAFDRRTFDRRTFDRRPGVILIA
jgi:hypothetical protein